MVAGVEPAPAAIMDVGKGRRCISRGAGVRHLETTVTIQHGIDDFANGHVDDDGEEALMVLLG